MRILALALTLASIGLCSPAAGAPRIVNGRDSTLFPSVGAVLTNYEPQFEYCSGTLIGCRTFMVAAHCVCPEGDLNATDCLREGTDEPSLLVVFFQHAGFFEVDRITIHPSFEFEVGGDVALLRLSRQVTGIAPAPLNRTGSPLIGTPGTIVGFGITRDDRVDTGVKRAGDMISGECPPNVRADKHICWSYDEPIGEPGVDSNTCDGDSGGPLFIAGASTRVLAGVTSGGEPGCENGSISWNSDVFANLAFIDEAGGDDLMERSCGALPQVEGPGTIQFTSAGQLSRSHTTARFTFEVPEGSRELRVALNGEDNDGTFRPRPPNDFDLFVRHGSAPDDIGNADCDDRTVGPYGYCEFHDPAPGTWHVLVAQDAGAGTFQLVATTFAPPAAACSGDCDSSGDVTVDEILVGVNIALGESQIGSCSNFDGDSNGSITVDELITAIDKALAGCR